MTTRPTDDDIIAALKQGSSRKLTAYVRDILARTHGRELKTGWVLARLKYLEASGKVRRVPTSYKTQIAWAVA